MGGGVDLKIHIGMKGVLEMMNNKQAQQNMKKYLLFHNIKKFVNLYWHEEGVPEMKDDHTHKKTQS